MSGLRIPLATYRLQFNHHFRFQDASELVSYLHQLGISDLYASPIFKACQGSLHGYDITDPKYLNPELGTEAEFNLLVKELNAHEMGLLLDIVPNHMAASPENRWWMDVLENGLCSPYAKFFDINWTAFNNRILLPVLTRPYKEVLRRGEINLELKDNGLCLNYYGLLLPLDIRSYGTVLSHFVPSLEEETETGCSDYQELITLHKMLTNLPRVTGIKPAEAADQYQNRQNLKESLLNLVNTSARLKSALLQAIALFNKAAGGPENFPLMRSLLEQQNYLLEYWQIAREKFNYRRFFDINDLIGIRVEETSVFEATHSLILKLIREGRVSGLRIDHVDGLQDPLRYLQYLQEQIKSVSGGASGRMYLVVEKILAAEESLPAEWPVAGTTGYDFASIVIAFFIDSEGIPALDSTYLRFIGAPAIFNDIVYEKKKLVIKDLFPAEIHGLGQYLTKLTDEYASYSVEELVKTLVEITACLPVYRTYIRNGEISRQDRACLQYAIKEVRRRNPSLNPAAFSLLSDVLTLEFPPSFTHDQKAARLDFIFRWQQFSGAVMAKGWEDTALYSYNRLISLNEVGGNPASRGLSIREFHHYNQVRLKQQKNGLNATSTHDTKRSEDVRARINVLAEIPLEWQDHLNRWQQYNQTNKQPINGVSVPEPNMEIFIYQTLLGAWPLDEKEVSEFKQRLALYIIKAAREAKTYTNWLSPNSAYEAALTDFLNAILDNAADNPFLEEFIPLEKRVAYYGMLNSLSQVLLKITLPGVPDFYQGTELWDFSLVDPDNRRPIDFKRRVKFLSELIQRERQGQEPLILELMQSWQDGRIKLYLTYKALNLRNASSSLFQEGEYLPLGVSGPRQENICAFARHRGNEWVMVVVPRLFVRLVSPDVIPFREEVWQADKLLLPAGSPQYWSNVFTGEKLKRPNSNRELKLYDVLKSFPVGLLVGI